jgi:hypothetical protein
MGVFLALTLVLLASALLGVWYGRNSQWAQSLVCKADGALHDSRWAQEVVPCAKAADPDEQAYNDYLQCNVGKQGCAQKQCADRYISLQPHGKHFESVSSAQSQAAKSCLADQVGKQQAQDFAAFNECMRTTPNVCDQNSCVDRYKGRINAEPYATSLKQAAQTVAQACAGLQEEAAFATFNQCVAQTVPCDTAKCASAFTSRYPSSRHIAQVLQVAEKAAITCKTPTPYKPPEPPPAAPRSAEAAAKEFLLRYYYVSSSQGEAAGNDLNDLFASTVNFYGKMRSRSDIMNEKRAYNARWDGRRFVVQPDSISTSCQGDTCHVRGASSGISIARLCTETHAA